MRERPTDGRPRVGQEEAGLAVLAAGRQESAIGREVDGPHRLRMNDRPAQLVPLHIPQTDLPTNAAGDFPLEVQLQDSTAGRHDVALV